MIGAAPPVSSPTEPAPRRRWPVHKPGKAGDRRNGRAHVLATTRAADESGLGAKTRTLDVAQSAAAGTNGALKRAGVAARVDHRRHENRAWIGFGLFERHRTRTPPASDWHAMVIGLAEG